MKILLVDSSPAALGRYAHLFGGFDERQLDILRPDIGLALPQHLPDRLQSVDLLVLGSSMLAQAMDIVAAAHRGQPSLSIFVFVTKEEVSPAAQRAAKEQGIAAVIPDSVPPREFAETVLALFPALRPPAKTSTFEGRVKYLEALGTGRMGVVYLCSHLEESGKLIAVKVLSPGMARDAKTRARFDREVRAVCTLSHPHVIRGYEVFEEGDFVAYSMEYAGGGSLARRLAEPEPLAIPEIVRILSEVCDGLQAIHEAGFIHRNIKPQNILFNKAGEVKISDFGIALSARPTLTDTGAVVGTIDYASPEYFEHGAVTVLSDIYAVGMMAYEMLTKSSPFDSDSVVSSMMMRLSEDPPPPNRRRRDCPEMLSFAVVKALARDPKGRFQSAAEMKEVLEKIEIIELG